MILLQENACEKKLNYLLIDPDPLIEKIDELAELPNGWRYGEGVSLSDKAIKIAKRIYNEISFSWPKPKTDVFPGTDGSLSVVFYKGDSCIEILVSAEGRLDITKEVGEGFAFEEVESKQDITFNDVIVSISDLLSPQWISYGYFTPETGTELKSGSAAPVFRTRVMEQESPLWTQTVLQQVGFRYVPILSSSILTWLGNQSFFGNSQPAHYQERCVWNRP